MTKQKTSSTPATTGAGAARPVKWVSFVGSGPGDPGLLTVRAVELLREAEIVITEVPDHEQLVRTLLGLPGRSPRRTRSRAPSPSSTSARCSSTAASARTASR